MRVILSGGGTAGHVYPALALARRLAADGAEVLFVGTPDSIEQRLAQEAHVAFEAIFVLPLESDYTIWRGPDRARYSTLVTAPLSWFAARRPARRIIDSFEPDVVVGFGGYVCTPIVGAALRRGVPVVLHEQNSVMGKANRRLARGASVVALTFEDTRTQAQRATSGRIEVTGNPVRPRLLEMTRQQARSQRGLDAGDIFVLVFGGSRGARTLNNAFARIAGELLADRSVHILHATGQRDYEQIMRKVSAAGTFRERYEIVAYIDAMDTVMPAADLIVARAGSTTIAEIGALAIPSVLVPFALATEDHQTKNARTLVEAGAAVLVRDDQLDTPLFGETLIGLIADAEVRSQMAGAARSLSAGDALDQLATLVEDLGGRTHAERPPSESRVSECASSQARV